jgi:hypothetical protein
MPDKTIIDVMRDMIALADSDPDFIPPNVIENFNTGGKTECRWFPFAIPADEARIGGAVRRSIGGTWSKEVTTGYLYLKNENDDTRHVIILDRAQVCRKIVTGTETVTKTVKDPEALANIPMVEVTVEVETFEWMCDPILGD